MAYMPKHAGLAAIQTPPRQHRFQRPGAPKDCIDRLAAMTSKR
jgi:hypothetical protein